MFINYFGIFICYIIFKILCLFYNIYTFDTSDAKLFINKNKSNSIVFATYGHTSAMDALYCTYFAYTLNCLGFAKKIHKSLYPKFLHNNLYFIENKSSNIRIKRPFAMFIEGTRDKLPYIRSGFKYIAINNKSTLVYMILNFSKNKLELSEAIYTPLDLLTDNELLHPLKELIKNKSPKDYAIYPSYCSDIKFK